MNPRTIKTPAGGFRRTVSRKDRVLRLTLDPRAPSALAPMVKRKSSVTRIPEAPGGSRGVTGCATMTGRVGMAGRAGGFGRTREGNPQVHGVDSVTPRLPPGALGEERARIKCEPYNSAHAEARPGRTLAGPLNFITFRLHAAAAGRAACLS